MRCQASLSSLRSESMRNPPAGRVAARFALAADWSWGPPATDVYLTCSTTSEIVESSNWFESRGMMIRH